jgi:hypothetical protein
MVMADVEASGSSESQSSLNADLSDVTLKTRLTARRYFGREVYCRRGYRESSQSRWIVKGGLRAKAVRFVQ